MITLDPNQCRVLGVLVEKALTVPASYPLTLNALVLGCNQKNNRDPLTNLDEEAVLDALEALRRLGLAVEVSLSGSRVAKFKHNAREGLGVTTEQLVVLVELMLRGPQTAGSLRANASRMAPIDSLERCLEILESLMRPGGGDGAAPPREALVRELPPEGRARRFAQVLCPDLHPVSESPASHHAPHHAPVRSPTPSSAADSALAARVDELEREVARLRSGLTSVAAQLGITLP
ncbi:MAG: YceH family protein [Phycisphaerales bacterium]